MSYERILYDVRSDGVCTVTLDQPETRNALTTEMVGELLAAVEHASADDAVGVIVLRSSHERIFSSGGNLAGYQSDAPLVEKYLGLGLFPKLFTVFSASPKPTLCAANGHVLAGGVGLALACDLVIARDDVTFGTPEINVVSFPFMVSAMMYRNVPRKKANEMLLVGERYTAEEALAAGMINKVVATREFDAAVDAWATRLASKSRILMRLGKEAMHRQQDMRLPEALEYLHGLVPITLTTEDSAEGVRAFFEKREPVWSGR